MSTHDRQSGAAALLLAMAAAAAVAMLLAAASPARAYSGQIQWVHTTTPNGAMHSIYNAVAPGPKGSVIVAGYTNYSTPTSSDVLMERLRSTPLNGILVQWNGIWDSASHGVDAADRVVVDRSGNATAVGRLSAVGGSPHWLLVSRSAGGRFRWSASYDGGYEDIPRAAAVDPSGNVLVAGYSLTAATNVSDLVVRKFAASDGHPLWTYKYTRFAPPQGFNEANGIAVDRSGNAYVSGTLNEDKSASQLLLLKLTPKGRLAWVRTLRNATHTSEYAFQVAAGGRGAYVAASQGGSGPDQGLLVAHYSAAGRLLWRRSWPGMAGSAELQSYSMSLDGLGNVLVAGTDRLSDGQLAGYVASWRPDGRRRYVRTYWSGVTGKRTTGFEAVVGDGAGNAWAAGFTYPTWGDGATADGLLVRLTPRGAVTWVRSYDAGFNLGDSYQGVTLSGATSVVAVGSSQSGPGGPFVGLAVRYRR